MRRAVILAILALLLLAVADVTAAQEGVFESAGPGVDVSETTVPENIAPEPTGPHRLAEFLDLGRLLVGRRALLGGGRLGIRPFGKDKGSEKAGKGGRLESADRTGDVGGRRGKVTVCHKGEKTLTV